MALILTLAIATLFGFLAGLGVGGGSLLLLWLTQVMAVPAEQARLINLLFFLPAAATSAIGNIRRRQINYKIVIPAVIAGCICAAVFTYIGNFTQQDLLKKLLGGLLILTGLKEICYRRKNVK